MSCHASDFVVEISRSHAASSLGIRGCSPVPATPTVAQPALKPGVSASGLEVEEDDDDDDDDEEEEEGGEGEGEGEGHAGRGRRDTDEGADGSGVARRSEGSSEEDRTDAPPSPLRSPVREASGAAAVRKSPKKKAKRSGSDVDHEIEGRDWESMEAAHGALEDEDEEEADDLPSLPQSFVDELDKQVRTPWFQLLCRGHERCIFVPLPLCLVLEQRKIADLVLPMGPATVFKVFLSDEAEFALTHHYHDQGDTEISSSLWKEVESDDQSSGQGKATLLVPLQVTPSTCIVQS